MINTVFWNERISKSRYRIMEKLPLCGQSRTTTFLIQFWKIHFFVNTLFISDHNYSLDTSKQSGEILLRMHPNICCENHLNLATKIIK